MNLIRLEFCGGTWPLKLDECNIFPNTTLIHFSFTMVDPSYGQKLNWFGH